MEILKEAYFCMVNVDETFTLYMGERYYECMETDDVDKFKILLLEDQILTYDPIMDYFLMLSVKCTSITIGKYICTHYKLNNTAIHVNMLNYTNIVNLMHIRHLTKNECDIVINNLCIISTIEEIDIIKMLIDRNEHLTLRHMKIIFRELICSDNYDNVNIYKKILLIWDISDIIYDIFNYATECDNSAILSLIFTHGYRLKNNSGLDKYAYYYNDYQLFSNELMMITQFSMYLCDDIVNIIKNTTYDFTYNFRIDKNRDNDSQYHYTVIDHTMA